MKEQWSNWEKKDAVILFAGKKGSGKNTAAEAFQKVCEERFYSCHQYAYADELRAHLSILDPIVGVRSNGVPWRWNEAIEMFGYDEAKVRFPEMRRLMQVYGTEVVRQRVAADYWTEKLKRRIHSEQQLMFSRHTVSLVTDVRFENEALCWPGIRSPEEMPDAPCYQILIYVRRPSLESDDNHSSESFSWLLNPDPFHGYTVWLDNTDDREKFVQKAENLANALFNAMPGFGQRTSTNP